MFCGFCWWCMQEIKSLKIWLRKGGFWERRQRVGGENKFICYRLQVYDGILCVHVNKSYVIYPFVKWLLLWASSCFCFHNAIYLRHGKESSFYCSHQFFKFNFLRIRVAEFFLPLNKRFIMKCDLTNRWSPKFHDTPSSSRKKLKQTKTLSQAAIFPFGRKVFWHKFSTTVV